MVAHLAAIHGPHATSRLYACRGVDHAIVKCYHDAGRFKHRAWLHQVAHGVVFTLAILSVATFLHVYKGFNVARGHLHHNGHAHVAMHIRFFQFLHQGALGQVLYAYIDGGYHI